jgi:hypothetical protein
VIARNHVGNTKLNTSVGYGMKDAGKIGTSPNSTKDELPAYTKGVHQQLFRCNSYL